ncbi:MAG: hypothetical protein QOI12_5150 [Alphaproteobacteria bacterium]|nr:hypothetical protein [Alphaproteobacteria bacterium]
MGHADDVDPLFTENNLSFDLVEPIWVFDSRDGVDEINAVLAAIESAFGIVPFVLHSGQTTGFR